MSMLPTTLVPSTPAGYQPGYVVRHPIGALNLVALVLSIVLVPLLAVIIWELHGGPSELQVDISFTLVDIAGACSTAMLTIVVHELIHGIVLRLFGYRVSFGVEYRLFVAYAAAFRQIQTRNHALMTALAPVVIITTIMLPLLALPNPGVVVAAFAALLTNTAGAVGDVYLTWRLLRLPRQTLLYDVDPSQMLIFVPLPQ